MKLTHAERFFLGRRRLGMTLSEMAVSLGVSQYPVWCWEAEALPVPALAKPIMIKGKPSKAESCLILRRRSGKTRDLVASEMGVSLTAITRMEAGARPCGPLAEYWGI